MKTTEEQKNAILIEIGYMPLEIMYSLLQSPLSVRLPEAIRRGLPALNTFQVPAAVSDSVRANHLCFLFCNVFGDTKRTICLFCILNGRFIIFTRKHW